MDMNFRLDFLKMKKGKLLRLSYWVCCCIWLLPQVGAGQADTTALKPLHEIKMTASLFTTDRLRNVYTVSKTNEVVKYNPEGVPQFRYNNNTFGELGYIDATDPFNLLLFYPDYRTVVLLDRTLSENGLFDLYDLDVIDVPAVGISSDNNLWIYDDVKFNVKKINRNGAVVLESNNISLVLGKTLYPNFILERNNQLYVNDSEVGILVFDLFGNYNKTLDIKGLQQFQVIDNQLIYQKEGQLQVYNLRSLQTRSLDLRLPLTGTYQVRIEKDRLYVQAGLLLKVYALKQ